MNTSTQPYLIRVDGAAPVQFAVAVQLATSRGTAFPTPITRSIPHRIGPPPDAQAPSAAPSPRIRAGHPVVFINPVENPVMQWKQPSEEEIRARAFILYSARGSQPGHAMDDWLQAEYELTQLPILKVAELTALAAIKPRRAPRKGALARVAQLALLAVGGGLAQWNA